MSLDELTRDAIDRIKNYKGDKIRIMEVCGTHTHEIFKSGIRGILPPNIELISGPGCPVCVTPVSYIDEAIWLATEKRITVFTFGDLIRVPGTDMNLALARSKGASVKVVYSPLDAVSIAKENPNEEVVFLGTGFETTTPASCLAVKRAAEEDIKKFTILTANKTMFNAYLSLKDSVDVFMYPGHVSVMTGMAPYYKLRDEYNISGIVTGFNPSEVIRSIDMMIEAISKSRSSEKKSGKIIPFAFNCYEKLVQEKANQNADRLVSSMMKVVDSEWRGLGMIKGSGLELNENFKSFDARIKHNIPEFHSKTNKACRCGDVLRGEIRPTDCPLFGKSCIPEHPVGACMVSGEGACSAYYKYGRFERK